MEIVQIVGIGIVATILTLILKTQRPEMAIQLSIVTGLIMFCLVIGKIEGIIALISAYAQKANINNFYFTILLKIIGISYIAEFGSEICKDAGASSIASKIELSGKIIIITLSVPIITSLLELIIKIAI